MRTTPLPGMAFLILLGTACALVASPVPAAIIPASGDLLVEIQAIQDEMPRRDSEGFTEPTAAERDQWRAVVGALLDGAPAVADSLVDADLLTYTLFLYTDTGNDGAQYYLLRESFPVSLGWGTVIVNPAPAREVAVELPHALYDLNTHTEGTDIFRRIGARLLVMAGTHRCANDEASPCDGTSTVCGDGVYHVSDMAHFAAGVFQVAHEEFVTRSPESYQFSVHGTSRTSCPDIFLSNGHATDSQQILFDLRDHMNGSGDIVVSVAGDGSSSCSLVGSTNVQGRFTNGSSNPCTQAVSSTTGRFIHAEQQRRVRDDPAVYSKFIDAIVAMIPATQTAVGPRPSIETGFRFARMGQNPVARTARFSLSLVGGGAVKVEAFDISGRRVATLYGGSLAAGIDHQIVFKTGDLSNGTYFVCASAGGVRKAHKITVLR